MVISYDIIIRVGKDVVRVGYDVIVRVSYDIIVRVS